MSDQKKMTNEEEEARQRRRERRLREERRRRKRRIAILLRIGCVVVFLLIITGIVFGVKSCRKAMEEREAKQKAQQEEQARKEAEKKQKNQSVIEESEKLAVQYDYDGAIALVKEVEGYEEDTALTAKITAYEKDKAGLVTYDVEQVEHFVFRNLIANEEMASSAENAAVQEMNQNTMTVEAFQQTLQEMYEDGYLLVSIRDLVKEKKAKDGKVTYEKGELKLPAGKKPFILSQEDVSYPFVLTSSGYGSKMVLGEDGGLAVEYKNAEGNMVKGDYDVVPCLEAFLLEHPDFSYRGARGILGLTGYNGVLGYRTDEDLAKSAVEGNVYADYGTFDTEVERENCKAVIEALRAKGWEFACNGYSGMSYASTMDRVQADVQKWTDRVGSLIGGTDLLLYPGGTDIGSWKDYEEDNAKYAYLKSMGFSFFCNIDNANEYWVQIRSSYVRQSRKKPKSTQTPVQPEDVGDETSAGDEKEE